jgi:type IV pilus assembly protein PilM
MSAQSQLYINLGSGHVSVAEFGPLTGAKGTLKSYSQEALDYDFLDEDQWLGATTSALRRLVSFNKISGPVNIILPGFLLLAKAIKVPHVDASRQAQIIAFEAQTNIPYPLHEVVWSYQVVQDDGVEVDVLLVAIKAEIAENICKMLEGLRLVPVSLLASPVLDYNAYRFNNPDESGEFLIVNIGMKNTNLAFGSADHLTLRNVSIGGNALTQNIANNLGKNFSEAESLKVTYYSEQEPDPDHEFASVFATNSDIFVRRIQSDITRSLANYKKHSRGSGPARVLLTGRGSLVPGLAEHLGEKLGVPVEYFNPLERYQVLPSANQELVALNGFLMGELIGAQVALEKSKAFKLDLLPEEMVAARQFRKQQFWYVAAAAIFGASLVYPWLTVQQGLSAAQAEAAKLDAPLRTLQAADQKVKDLQARIKSGEERIGQLAEVVESMRNWNEFLVDLQDRLVSIGDVWIESLQVERREDTNASGSGVRSAVPSATAGNDESGPLVLQLEGRVIDRDNPLSRVSEDLKKKAEKFIQTMGSSPFLNEVTLKRYDDTMPGILRFEFTISINPERPL